MCQKSRQSANCHGYLTSAFIGGAVTLYSNANSGCLGCISFVKNLITNGEFGLSLELVTITFENHRGKDILFHENLII